MKRTLALVLLSLSLSAFAFAEGAEARGLYVLPSADVTLGLNNYLRGAAAGGTVMYDLGFLALGIDAHVDYDSWFNCVDLPLTLIVGFGRDFWVGAGYTLPLGSPYVLVNGVKTAFLFGSALPNSYVIGINIFRADMGFASLVVPTRLSYTVNSPVATGDTLSDGVGGLVGVLAGLKGSVGAAVEFKF